MPFPASYNLKIESTLRTLTINERFSHATTTGNLNASATPIAQDFLNVITNGSLTAKSIHGTVYFGALSGRTLGGQTTYFNNPNGAATPFDVEPEHRISFSIDPNEWTKSGQSPTLLLADVIQRKVLEGFYQYALYKH